MATQIEQDCPTSLEFANLQPRGAVYPSPADWSDEVLYFLLPDRFSDGKEPNRAMFDRADPKRHLAADMRQWMDAGKVFVGGNLRGLRSKLPYIKGLGATAIWLGPIWKQRADLQTYHGYGIQNFLDVDPHFGTRQDLRDLVDEAHSLGLRVLLDVIYNHSGNNWFYDENAVAKETLPFRREPYPFHGWRSASGASIAKCVDREDGVWPIEFQDPSWYTRCGKIQNWDEPGKELERDAEFRLGDFGDLKDLKLEKHEVLDAIIRVYQYWIALSDCDGFRIDTVKHVPPEISAIFCHDIRSFARRLGKKNFMLLGEVTGATTIVRKYVDPEGPNLDCILDIESAPQRLADFVKGHGPPQYFFDHFGGRDALGDVRTLGKHHVSILDDHDMVWRTSKGRFACGNCSADVAAQTAHAVGVQLTTPGIPCIYYGTEQCFCGGEGMHLCEHECKDPQGRVPCADRYVREAMFGGEFGAFGTQHCHFFDESHPAYQRIAAIARLRRADDRLGQVLRRGDLYVREIRYDQEFVAPVQGHIVAWSRVTEQNSILVVINTHGNEPKKADVTVDSVLHPGGSKMKIRYRGDWDDNQLRNPPEDEFKEVLRLETGRCYVSIELPPAGMMILG
jgi:glycosidase